jgi:hypothetical protein
MQMVPDSVRPGASQAERRIFEQLKETETPGWDFAFHQINLREHRDKRVSEADFVLLGKRGILLLEVKGGEVTCKDRIWHTRSLNGKAHRLHESPLGQAKGAQFALEKLMITELGRGLVGRTVFGHGVVFPDVEFDVPGVEWDAAQIIDSQYLEDSGWAAGLDRLGCFWEQKPGDRHGLSDEDVQRYLALLRPRFELVPRLLHLTRDVETELVALTANQYRALDSCGRNPRLLFEGGAGTGKTMLAAEMCRRARSAGSRVLLTCRNGILARFLRAQPGLENVDVHPFHALRELETDEFDLVVVDEAQDIINRPDLLVLDRLLSGGLEDGRWMFLLDSNNQRGLVGSYDDEAMSVLRGYRPTDFMLTENCRNTVQIVQATQERTGADLGATSVGQGLEVTFLEGPADEVREAVGSHLDMLEEQQMPLRQVVLLSPYTLAESIFNDLPGRWRDRVVTLDLVQHRKPAPGHVGFARVADFKGLERQFVLLEAAHDHDPQAQRAQLYVGMTRARTQLWVVTDTDSAAKGHP